MGGENKNMKPLIFKFGVSVAFSLGGVVYLIARANWINKPKSPQSGEGKSAATSHCCVQPACDKQEELANNGVRANTKAYEREISYLTNLVRVLRERVGSLEIQLLEYYGLKEQEAVVMELKNRLKLNNMEAKIYSLKIESLQADNRRLEAQLSDYSKVVNELEAARGKIKLLKKKLRFESEQNKELIMALQQRVQLLQDVERQSEKNDVAKSQKMKNLEEELEELRKSNHCLRVENSELVQKLDFTRLLANSVLEEQEVECKNENIKLQQQNKDLRNQIERLQAARCADVEQLVYLRWINACLRRKLKNYNPTPGKNTKAKDLIKTVSPISEPKRGEGGKGISIMDSNLDHWSSNFTVSYEDSPIDISSSSKTDKEKFMSRLKRLVTGKDNHNQCRRRSSSLEDFCKISTPGGVSVTSSQDSSKTAFVKDSGFFFRKNDAGNSNFSSISNSSEEIQVSENVKKSELVKYAKVLKDSSKENLNLHQNPARRHSL